MVHSALESRIAPEIPGRPEEIAACASGEGAFLSRAYHS